MNNQVDYLQGRRFARECLSNIGGCTPTMISGILRQLEDNAKHKPEAEARGIMDIVTIVRVWGFQ